MEQKQPLSTLYSDKAMDIQFENVWLTVRQGKGYKKVVKGVNGLFKSGELTAIMGPSGAGKTSLLNILTGYQQTGVEGIIKCKNGKMSKTGADQYKSKSCYILQDDYLISYFTVYEIMYSTTKLKIANLSPDKTDLLIDDILSTLGLLKLKKTLCGNLSGGQKKRLSIALELIDDPPIMFLDEPTTGLDSNSSNQCIEMLKALAERGRTIVCTIHQPSSSLYHTFNHVYVMASGKCVYQGAPENTVDYLASHGFVCPKYHNPADFLLEILCEEESLSTDKLAVSAQESHWRSSILDKAFFSDNGLNSITHVVTKRTRPTEFKRFLVLLNKQIAYCYRDWTAAKLKLIINLLVGIFLGITFQGSGYDASKVIQNSSLQNVSVVYLCYTSLMPAALRFPDELRIIKKEYFNRWYKLRTFYLAYLAADLPMQIMFATAYTIGSYVISSQPLELNRFLMVLLVHSMVTLIAAGMGVMYGTLLSPVNGTFFGAVTTSILFCMDGSLCLFPHMNKFFYFLSNFSYLANAMQALMMALYSFNREDLRCPENEDYCLYTNSNQFLSDFGMTTLPFWVNVVSLAVNFVIIRVLAFGSLNYKIRNL